MRHALAVVLLCLLAAVPTLAQSGAVDLRVEPTQSYTRVLEPGEAGFFAFTVHNDGTATATDVVATLRLPAGGSATGHSLSSIAATCTQSPGLLTCTVASLPAHETFSVSVGLTAPSRNDGVDMRVEVEVTSAQPDARPVDNHIVPLQIAMFRVFTVTNVADEGAGSLRRAIEDVNGCAHDVPCAIAFNIPAPVPEQGWFTIQPRTPLPEITGGTLRLNGGTQTTFTGDSNYDGPEIEINGALVREEAGVRVQPHCYAIISNLAINGFPGYGLSIVRRPELGGEHCLVGGSGQASLTGNYLGTDPRGRVAKPNMRGLRVLAGDVDMSGNIISGNRRSGIYVEGATFLDVRHNRIGVGGREEQLGNGAGILLDMEGGADIEHNIIAYNNGMAIARTRTGEIFVSGNWIFDNLQQGIDVDIDGPTPQRPNDLDVPNAPVLFSATYDPVTNTTRVRGRLDSNHLATFPTIEVYASARNSVWSTPQAEQYVSSHHVNRHADFELAAPGDWRGKWITATYNAVFATGGAAKRGITTQNHRLGLPADTSELSNSVFCQ